MSLHSVPWLRRLTCVSVFALWFSITARGVSAQNDVLEAHLHVIREQATVGEALTWIIEVTPTAQEPPVQLTFAPADETSWEIRGITSGIVVTCPTALSITGVPRVAGDLSPALQITYTTGDQTYARLLVAPDSVQVTSVDAGIVAELEVPADAMRPGERQTLYLRVQNDTPFTLDEIRLDGKDPSLEWGVLDPIEGLTSGATIRRPITVTVTQEATQPVLFLTLTWHDGRGSVQQRHRYVVGSRFVAPTSTWADVPREAVTIALGAVAGIVPGIGVWSFQRYLERRSIKRSYWRQVRGLIHFTLLQSEHAVANYIRVDLDALTMVLKETDLLEQTYIHELTGPAQKMWSAAAAYNDGLAHPNASQRITALDKARAELHDSLARATKRRKLSFPHVLRPRPKGPAKP